MDGVFIWEDTKGLDLIQAVWIRVFVNSRLVCTPFVNDVCFNSVLLILQSYKRCYAITLGQCYDIKR